jgi:plasmid stabilization system protein ParE
MALIYSPEALDDFAAIWAYFASDRSEAVATRVLRDLQAKIMRLEKAPLLGHERSELGGGVRCLPLAGHDYVVYYLVIGRRKRVEIARILHGRRDIGTALSLAPPLS